MKSNFFSQSINYIIILMTLHTFVSCQKEETKSELKFQISNVGSSNNNIKNLKFEIINSSDTNYFICFDLKDLHYTKGLNYIPNGCIHPRPVFFFNNDSIRGDYIVNSFSNPTFDDNCIENMVNNGRKHLIQFTNLNLKLLLKKHSKTILWLPFYNTHYGCGYEYTYIRTKGNYELQFKYKMNQKYFEKMVEKEKILELNKKGFKPYFHEIISNKVPFIVE